LGEKLNRGNIFLECGAGPKNPFGVLGGFLFFFWGQRGGKGAPQNRGKFGGKGGLETFFKPGALEKKGGNFPGKNFLLLGGGEKKNPKRNLQFGPGVFSLLGGGGGGGGETWGKKKLAFCFAGFKIKGEIPAFFWQKTPQFKLVLHRGRGRGGGGEELFFLWNGGGKNPPNFLG